MAKLSIARQFRKIKLTIEAIVHGHQRMQLICGPHLIAAEIIEAGDYWCCTQY